MTLFSATDSWSVEGEFLTFAAANMPFLGEGMFIAPKSRSDDGYNDVILILGSTKRLQFARILLAEDSGGHLGFEEVTYEKVKRWRLEPEGRAGIVNVDGEVRGR